MTREEKYPDTITFHFFNANPKGRITVDCVYRAVSTATEKPWATVVMDLAEIACKTGYEPTDHRSVDKYLSQNGFVRMKQPRKDNNTKYTGYEFCMELQNRMSSGNLNGAMNSNGIYVSNKIVAHIGGHHMVAIVDGKINDIWNSSDGCIGKYLVKIGGK